MVKQLLTVDTTAVEKEHQLYKDKYTVNANDHVKDASLTPRTEASTPNSAYGPVRGRSDIRSPGISKTPSIDIRQQQHQQQQQTPSTPTTATTTTPIPDFITQTDRYGNASTPRTPFKGQSQGQGGVEKTDTDETEINDPQQPQPHDDPVVENDACDTLLENLRMMCCCLLPNGQHDMGSNQGHHKEYNPSSSSSSSSSSIRKMQITKKRLLPGGGSMYGHVDETSTFHETSQIKLLPDIIPQDRGKKCLVLDLDETLVHSSFRAVSGADFVIPVQIEDVVHFVYVAKRPGVDEFLVEMAKHYEIILYTASLNKYADPLLDLLDPHQTIRTRLFRESCVYYEGNYVKDLSLLNRDLSTTIIVDNSPSSYIFHPQNAIDCTSFIDDPTDCELDQIGSFLAGIKNVKDVRNVCNMWREWPHIPRLDNIESPAYESREDKPYQ